MDRFSVGLIRDCIDAVHPSVMPTSCQESSREVLKADDRHDHTLCDPFAHFSSYSLVL